MCVGPAMCVTKVSTVYFSIFLAAADSIKNMSNSDFRKEFRKEQLKNLIKGEISTLLQSRGAYRRFNIGPATIDVDLEFFHLSPQQAESSYGYKKSR